MPDLSADVLLSRIRWFRQEDLFLQDKFGEAVFIKNVDPAKRLENYNHSYTCLDQAESHTSQILYQIEHAEDSLYKPISPPSPAADSSKKPSVQEAQNKQA